MNNKSIRVELTCHNIHAMIHSAETTLNLYKGRSSATSDIPHNAFRQLLMSLIHSKLGALKCQRPRQSDCDYAVHDMSSGCIALWEVRLLVELITILLCDETMGIIVVFGSRRQDTKTSEFDVFPPPVIKHSKSCPGGY